MAPTRPNTRNNSSSQDDSMSVDDKLNLLINEVRQLRESNNVCLSEISEIKNDNKLFKDDLNKSLDMCFSKINDCELAVKGNTTRISSCENLIENLSSENALLKKSVGELKKKVAAGEQYSRSNCLEIIGVPDSNNENITDVVKQVANALNFKLEDSMIDAVHRLAKHPNKPQNPRGIILKFCRRVDLEEMRRKARVKRSISAAEIGYNSENRIFINLSLGRETRQLWAEVRSFKDRHQYKFAWVTSAGKIFLRKKENQAAILITEVSDLHSLK